jgi:hypothetical protein
MKQYSVYYNSKGQKGLGVYEVHTPECKHHVFGSGGTKSITSMEYCSTETGETAQQVAEEYDRSNGYETFTKVSPCAKGA